MTNKKFRLDDIRSESTGNSQIIRQYSKNNKREEHFDRVHGGPAPCGCNNLYYSEDRCDCDRDCGCECANYTGPSD